MARKTPKLTKVFGLREDKVAVRALTDILGKAIGSGQLSNMEKQWAQKLQKAIEKSGPEQLVYPKLSLQPDSQPDTSLKTKAKATSAMPKRGIEDDPFASPAATSGKPDPAMASSQDAWDSFANMGKAPQDDPEMDLGPAGGISSAPAVDPTADKVPNIKKPGMLSRIFSKKPGAAKPNAKPAKPGKKVAQSTWDDYDNGRGREPEDRK